MTDNYSYLIVGVIYLIIAISLLFFHKLHLKLILFYGMMGGVAALFIEHFYLKDYWQPPTILGAGKVSIEDFIAGFALSIVAILLFPVLTNKHFKTKKQPNRKNLIFFSICAIAAMLILNLWLNFNSIFVSYLLFAGISIFFINKRYELLFVVLKSALLFTLLSVIIYVSYLFFFSPNFWDKYWLLADTGWSISIFGLMPMTEILWFLGWGYAGLSAFLYIENLELH